jgi:hypothetical protein
MKKLKITALFTAFIIMTAVLTACEIESTEAPVSNPPSANENPSPVTAPTPPSADSGEFTLGDTFVFDSLEITFGADYKWIVWENSFSDLNGSDVVGVPITVKNLKDETHGLSMFKYTIYGSNGTKSAGGSFYIDDNIDIAGDMRSGATQEAFMYILYDGDGDYYIEFDDWRNKIEVRIPIEK